jgi:uncharacterized damage-inducible protein DinB
MPVAQPLDPRRELLEAFEHSYRVTEYVVDVLPSRVWRLEPPDRQGRSIAAIVAHLQSVRRMFAKTGGALPVPPALDRARSTPDDARRGLRQSREALVTLFREALAQGRPRVKRMPRRTVNMMIYLIQHDAHHRGQICALARALGHRFSKDDVMRIWGWKSLTPR